MAIISNIDSNKYDVGKYTYGIENISIICNDNNKSNMDSTLKIGSFCSIAANIRIYLGGNHNSYHVTTYPFGILYKDVFYKFNKDSIINITNGDVIIGNDVWIGDNVTIMSGVKIGDGCVIGNNSHVVSDVKPYSVVFGNPAKFHYFRFNDETIKKLLKIKWWDYSDDIINEILPLLQSDDNFDKLFDYFDNNFIIYSTMSKINLISKIDGDFIIKIFDIYNNIIQIEEKYIQTGIIYWFIPNSYSYWSFVEIYENDKLLYKYNLIKNYV